MDEIQKKKGVPWSTSRSEEKKNKHRTHKARRQQGKRQTQLPRSIDVPEDIPSVYTDDW